MKLTSYGELADVIVALPFLVRENRRRRGLSLRAAAKEVGCSFSTLGRFEGGEDITLSNAYGILKWLEK